MADEKEKGNVDHDTIRSALESIGKTLAPMSAEERRVIGAMIILYEIPIGKDPRAHGGDHECG